MSRIDDLIAEVRSDLSKYDTAGLIDELSITRDIIKGIKRFGNNVTHLQETVVEVKEGFAVLPDNFFSLYVAFLCEPLGYSKKVESDSLVSSIFYKEKTVRSSKWNECDTCCETVTESVIKENLYLNGINHAEFYYHRPQMLSLGKTFVKGNYHAKCRNKIVRDNPNEIVINDFKLQANFNEGFVYIQYYGLPLDEDGFIDIPTTNTGHLDTFLEYHAKRRLAERLIGNNDAQGLSNLYSIYRQEEEISLRNASNELKMKTLSPRSMRRMSRLNKLESLQYETNITFQWQ